ncbi:imm11 family protein [Rubrivirga sp. IMCC43871]|uniref:imm11 family protein n=1 Tax=Rubrivirga sp. IMCC43871 TaxID=3391575 RepID=UPI00399020BF
MDPDLRFFRFEPALAQGSAQFGHIVGFDKMYLLRKGAPVGDAFPADATYVMSDDAPDDLVVEDAISTLDSELVVSPGARAVLAPLVGDAVEWLEVGVVNHKGRREPGPYAIANALRLVDAVDRDASVFMANPLMPDRMMNVTELAVDEGRIPDDAVLFRLAGLAQVLGVRRDVTEAVRDAGLTGFDFLPFTSFRG